MLDDGVDSRHNLFVEYSSDEGLKERLATR